MVTLLYTNVITSTSTIITSTKIIFGWKQPTSARVVKISRDYSALKELSVICLNKIIPFVSELLPNLSRLDTFSINHSIMTTDNAYTISNYVATSQLSKLDAANNKFSREIFFIIHRHIFHSTVRMQHLLNVNN